MSASPTSKVYVDWGKLAQVAILVAATVALGIAGTISSEVVSGVLFGLAGYVFGNGKSVKEQGEGYVAPAPLIGRKPRTEPLRAPGR